MRLLFLATLTAGAILGLDYGQQYTKAAVLAPGLKYEIVLTDEGKRKDLSGVSIRGHGEHVERVYGSQMGSLCTRFPQSCIVDTKDLLGLSYDEASAWSEQHGVAILADDRHGVKFDLGFRNQSYQFTAEEILAMQLDVVRSRALKEVENADAVALVDDIAITVPPHASSHTRQAYLDALRLAGFNVLGLVDEGTAAAINYVHSRKFDKKDYNGEKETHVIFDMGAGSTKATRFSFTANQNGTVVVDIEEAKSEKKGGSDMTRSLFEVLKGRVKTKLNTKGLARLFEAAEKAKLILSTNNEYHVSLEALQDDYDFKTVVSRAEFEEIVDVDMMGPLREVLNSNVLSVILNGGATRTPVVQRQLAALVGEERVSKSLNTDESCAVGATQRGLQLKVDSGMVVMDRSNVAFEANGKEVFPKGSVPGRETVDFGDVDDLVVEVSENGVIYKAYEFTDLKSCKGRHVVGTFELDGNKMFDLVEMNVECRGGLLNFWKKEKGEEETEENENETEETEKEENETTTEGTEEKDTKQTKAPKTKSVGLPKPTYPNLKPLDRLHRLSAKLAYLRHKDTERIEVAHAKNLLEAACYELRGYMEANADVLGDHTKEYAAEVANTLEWLDFESDDAGVEQVANKTDAINRGLSALSRVVKSAEVSVTREDLEKLVSNGNAIVDTVQKSFLRFGNQVSDLRAKYDDQGFDFDKENKRLRASLVRKAGFDASSTMDEALTRLKDLLSALQAAVDDFDAYDRVVVYDLHAEYQDVVSKLLDSSLDLEQQHMQRVRSLEEKYGMLVKRKEKSEERRRVREKKKEEKKEKEEKEEKKEEKEEKKEEKEEKEMKDEKEEKEEKKEEKKDEGEEGVEHDEL